MTSRRFVLTGLAMVILSVMLACAGGAPTPATKAPTERAQAKPASGSGAAEAHYAAIIDEATKARDAALAMRETVRTRNEAAKQRFQQALAAYREAKAKYDADLAAFKDAMREYKAIKDLAFAKKLQSEASLSKWYGDIVSEYPGTAAAKEAQRRLNGYTPKSLPVPAKPPEPPDAPRKPTEPEYEPEPPIPEVPTIAELRAEDARRAESAKGGADDHEPPLTAYDMTKQGTGANQGKVYVHGYTTKSGKYVAPHYRNPPGAGSSRGRR